ncbi:DUF2971 domain-containing protein [Cellvibrio sp. KY-YJ-3]|uniref:DUF2971 domain-containing protein n=1 Tax=Cellvibrio sp. KY-YJ-3 TaxID=454662 RepID=UPI0012475DF2|nr:DUF2971 domain-containing protein [Cellvibrio sp. KY-YJ-3]QEY13596.1 DUF2971 domain-containing protein [Cellvibrio sp. KY-YJ-3]
MDNLLYKYRSVDKNGLDILINSALYFPTTSTFNDPFDGQLLPVDFENELKDLGLHPGPIKLSSANEHIKEEINRVGVFCLCKTPDDILMWSHYADSHQGFCLGFKPDLKRKIETNGIPINQYPIAYEADHPFKEIYENYPDINSFEDFINLCENFKKAALTVKHEHWRYEAEERLISRESGLYLFQPEALDCVILGMNISNKDTFTIKNLLNRAEWKHVRLLKAFRGKAALKLEIREETKFQPI